MRIAVTRVSLDDLDVAQRLQSLAMQSLAMQSLAMHSRQLNLLISFDLQLAVSRERSGVEQIVTERTRA